MANPTHTRLVTAPPQAPAEIRTERRRRRLLRFGLAIALPCSLAVLVGLSTQTSLSQLVTPPKNAGEIASANAAPDADRTDDPIGPFLDPPVVVWDAADPALDAQWEFKDPQGWRFSEADGQRVLSQFLKASDYQPPHRSPLHIALWKETRFDSFQMDVWVKSTHPEYGHRDVCLFFGYAAPDRFYYVHLASEMDDRANQIFVVDAADRVKISDTTTPGTRWDDDWHHVRIQRHHESGRIRVFFDDMDKPIMTAVHQGIAAGQVGFGSFDDTVDFRRMEIRRQQP